VIPELGQFALIIALLLSLSQVAFGLAGAARNNGAWMAAGRSAVVGQFVFISLAFGALAWSFVERDFSVLYVASNSHSELPLFYRIAAVWGAHEGSLLLWSLCLAGWTLAVTAGSGSLDPPFRIGGLVEAGSLKRDPNSLTVQFRVTDTAQTIPVTYTGLLPDLFKEGKGVVAQGSLGADGAFHATEVLAKHDENYMPPEAAQAIEQARKRSAMTLPSMQETRQ